MSLHTAFVSITQRTIHHTKCHGNYNLLSPPFSAIFYTPLLSLWCTSTITSEAQIRFHYNRQPMILQSIFFYHLRILNFGHFHHDNVRIPRSLVGLHMNDNNVL